MALGRRRPPRQQNYDAQVRALTASGVRVRRENADNIRRVAQQWQTRSFAYYDALGEIKEAAGFVARGLSKIELFAAERTEDGDVVPTENQDAIDELARLQDPGGGTSRLAHQYGLLSFLVGECMLLCTRADEDEGGGEQWEILSTDELRANPSGRGYVRYKAPSEAAEELKEPSDDDFEPVADNEAVAYRLWQPHPRYSDLADCTMRGVLDLCDELLMLTQAVRARSRSRLAGNGILFIDERISKAPPVPQPGEDPQEDKFVQALIEAMIAPMQNEGAASAVAPIVIRVPVPDSYQFSVKDMVAHLQLVDPTQLYPETGLRYECIKRIAIGLDMPAESLLGLQDSNHWTAWMISESTWTEHLDPKAKEFVDSLTAAFFRPGLRQKGVEDWHKYLISYDPAAAIVAPDRSKDAIQLFDRGELRGEALRTSTGFSEDDAPSPEERDWWLGWQIHDGALAKYGTPGIRSGGIEISPGVIEKSAPGLITDQRTAPDQMPDTNGNGGPPAAGPPTSPPAAAAARVAGAAQLALLRAREAAGNRVLTLAKRDRETLALADAARADGVRAGDIPATLGRDRVRALGAPSERDLIAGARELVADTFRLWGLPDDVTKTLADSVEEHAARTLYELRPAPLPRSFANYVEGALTLA